MTSWLNHERLTGSKTSSRWIESVPLVNSMTTALNQASGRGSFLPAQVGLMGAALQAVLFPPLPPWLQTACYACRVVALLIIAPIILIGVVDFAEYAVVRTLGEWFDASSPFACRRSSQAHECITAPCPSHAGLRSHKMRVKPLSNSQEHRNMRLSPAQMRNQPPAPLLSPGAYDAETLLRHRARSASSASVEAIMEWQRTGGSFARVSEVRIAASEAVTSDEEPKLPKLARANIGVDGPLGLSESEAEDSGTDSREGSPPIMRKGLKSSQLHFTPVNYYKHKTSRG